MEDNIATEVKQSEEEKETGGRSTLAHEENQQWRWLLANKYWYNPHVWHFINRNIPQLDEYQEIPLRVMVIRNIGCLIIVEPSMAIYEELE